LGQVLNRFVCSFNFRFSAFAACRLDMPPPSPFSSELSSSGGGGAL
jgi:hypothetical protein